MIFILYVFLDGHGPVNHRMGTNGTIHRPEENSTLNRFGKNFKGDIL